MWLRTGPESCISVDAYKKLTLGLHIDPWAFPYGVRWNWAPSLPWEMFLPLSYHSKAHSTKERRKISRIHRRQMASQHICWKFCFPTICIKIMALHLRRWGSPCAPLVHLFIWQAFTEYLFYVDETIWNWGREFMPKSVARLYYLIMFFVFSGFCGAIYAHM